MNRAGRHGGRVGSASSFGKNMSSSSISPVRHRKRVEQYALFKELKRSPGNVRGVNLMQNLLKLTAYFLFLYFVGLPLIDRIGALGFVLSFVAFTMIFDEIVWRCIVVPAIDRALQNRAEQGVAPQSATRSESDSEGGDKPQPESQPRPR